MTSADDVTPSNASRCHSTVGLFTFVLPADSKVSFRSRYLSPSGRMPSSTVSKNGGYNFGDALARVGYTASPVWGSQETERLHLMSASIWLQARRLEARFRKTTAADILAGLSFPNAIEIQVVFFLSHYMFNFKMIYDVACVRGVKTT